MYSKQIGTVGNIVYYIGEEHVPMTESQFGPLDIQVNLEYFCMRCRVSGWKGNHHDVLRAAFDLAMEHRDC